MDFETLLSVIENCLLSLVADFGIAVGRDDVKADALRWARIWHRDFDEFNPEPSVTDVTRAFMDYCRGAAISKAYPKPYEVYGKLRSIMKGDAAQEDVPATCREKRKENVDGALMTAWCMATGRFPRKPEHYVEWEQFGRGEYMASKRRRSAESAGKGVWKGGRLCA